LLLLLLLLLLLHQQHLAIRRHLRYVCGHGRGGVVR
jgi:hypothetical protein